MAMIIAAIMFVILPGGIMVFARAVPIAQKIGPIVLCYIVGMLIGVFDILPEAAHAARVSVTEVSLGLALPLLLFSVDMRAWRHVAGRAMLSMFLAVVSVVFVATILFYAFEAQGVRDPSHLSAMAVGMYTGGVANLGAIKHALAIPDAQYVLFATIDTFVGAIFLMFVLTFGQRFFGQFLHPFPAQYRIDPIRDDIDSYGDILNIASLRTGVFALLAAGTCVGIALGIAPLLGFASMEIMVIVLLTTVGLLASFVRVIRTNTAAPKLGMYLIYVFSLCVAASMDLNALVDMDLSILVFVLVATFGSLILHAVLCRFLRVDVDTFLITAVAALMSPAFVPMVARNLKNPAVLMSGMATGILGFAIGNYLGISVALILMAGE